MTTKPNKRWWIVSPILMREPVGRYAERPGVVFMWLTFGWDADVPLRPWPTFGMEVRPNGSVLTWIGAFGLLLCQQSAAFPLRGEVTP